MAIKAIVIVVAMDIFGLKGRLAWYAANHELDTHPSVAQRCSADSDDRCRQSSSPIRTWPTALPRREAH